MIDAVLPPNPMSSKNARKIERRIDAFEAF